MKKRSDAAKLAAPREAEPSETVDNPVGGGGKPMWREVLDKSSGKVYYVNRDTNETTWTKPAELGGGGGAGGAELEVESGGGDEI